MKRTRRIRQLRLVAGILMSALAGTALSGCASMSEDAVGLPPVKGSGQTAALAYYLRGTTAELGNQPTLAADSYLGSLAEDPDNLKLRLRSMNLALLGNDVPTALRLAKTLPAAIATQLMPQLALVMGDIHDGKLDKAKAGLDRLVKADPDVLQFVALQQQVRLAQGVPVSDTVNVLQTLKLEPAMEGRRQFQVARLWLRAGHQDEAIAALEKANGLEPAAVFTTLLLGGLYERDGQPDKALELYKVFRQRNPTSGLFAGEVARVKRGELPPAYAGSLRSDASLIMMDFSLLMWGQGALGPARQMVNTALWMSDTVDPWLMYYGGIVEQLGGDQALAANRYRLAAEAPGLEVAAGIRTAELDYQNDHQDAARERLDALGEAYPDEIAVWRSRADMALQDEDYATALDCDMRLEKLLGADAPADKRAEVLFAKGAALERLGRYKEAEQVLEDSLKLNRANPQVLNYLGYMWADKGDNLVKAQEYLQQALVLAPEDGAIIDSVGWVYFRRGEYAKAQVYLERAVEMTPDDATVTNHLGDVYAKLGRPNEAREQWQRALELVEPADRDLKKELKAKLAS